MLFNFWESLEKVNTKLDERILTVNSPELKGFLERLKKENTIAIDIETYSLEKDYLALDPLSLTIRLLSIGLPDQVLILDFDISRDQLKMRSKEYAEIYSILQTKGKEQNTRIIGHNLKYDLLALRRLGLRFFNCRDSMLISQILWTGVGVLPASLSKTRSERGSLSHSLKAVCERVGLTIDKEEQTSDWSKIVLTNSQLNYAAKDVLIMFPLINELGKLIQNHNLSACIVECKALSAFVEMEFNGFPIDIELAQEYLALYQEEYEKEKLIFQNTFGDLSPTATKKDLIPAIKEFLGLEVEDTTDSTLGLIENDAIQSLLNMRSLNISIQYLTNVIKKSTHSNSVGLGYKVRPMFRQITSGWRTGCDGKISHQVKNPKTGKVTRKKEESYFYMNLQQIPSKPFNGLPNIRKVFKAPENYNLIIADLSQAHARIACEMSGDKTLTKAYKEGLDNHLLMAHRILELEGYKLTFEEISFLYKESKKIDKKEWTEMMVKIKESRDIAKTAFYAFLNQAGAKTMTNTFSSQGVDISEEKCKELIKVLREVYEGLYTFIKSSVKEANSFNEDFSYLKDKDGKPLIGKYGKVKNLLDNYGYFIKLKNNFSDGEKQYPDQIPYTEAIAWQWLSSEATLIKTALFRINEKLYYSNYDAYLCGFTHDEINLITHKDCAKEVANLVGDLIKASLSFYIKSIPVEESSDYYSFIVSSLADK